MGKDIRCYDKDLITEGQMMLLELKRTLSKGKPLRGPPGAGLGDALRATPKRRGRSSVNTHAGVKCEAPDGTGRGGGVGSGCG
jgi:hypothetical protein